MIARVYMEENLRRLDRLYRRASTPKESLFYAKLAVLELCGWIEESMDDVVIRCSIRSLRDQQNRSFVNDSVVRRNYGFEYNKHFREMLIKVVGLAQIERLEKHLDPAKHAKFKATLGALATVRNSEAHTHLKGMTRVVNAPSVTISHFNDVYIGLREYDHVLRRVVR